MPQNKKSVHFQLEMSIFSFGGYLLS